MKKIFELTRVPSFWTLQIGGWLLYATAVAIASIPYRHIHEYVVDRSTFLIIGFFKSCALYVVCRFLWRRRISLLASLCWCFLAAFILGLVWITVAIPLGLPWATLKGPFQPYAVLTEALGNSFILVGWCMFYFGIKHYQVSEEQYRRLLVSEAAAREAQLRALQYQLQPHFLFNTLNTISTLVIDDQPRAATQMIAKLGHLLRSTLDKPDCHQVELEKELLLTQEYLAIEQIRFGDRLSVHFDIAPDTHRAKVPKFVLQPLVENAILHGIAKRPLGGHIAIKSIRAGAALVLHVQNDGASESRIADRHLVGSAHGLGISNTRSRLQELYRGAATIETLEDANGAYLVSLSIPFNTDVY